MRIGILGGSFNPIHLGHIKLAQEASAMLDLDKLIFVPNYISPHKLDTKDIIPPSDRFEMIKLAFKETPVLNVSDIEIKKKEASYSIETVKEFRKIYGRSAEIFFIVGSDSIKELDTWKDIDELKRLSRLVIATRPGYAPASRPEGTEIINVDTPDISSTEIREFIKEGKPFGALVPAAVFNYINEKKLYLEKPGPQDFL